MKIKLWTIQDEKGWNELQTKGVLVPKMEFVEPDFKEAYDWIKKRMIERIGKPNNGDQYPMWAWFQHFDSNKRKPDLRFSGYLPSNTTGYRIELEKEKKDILLSEFELWHYVLNKWYLPIDITDYEIFEKKLDKLNGVDFKSYPDSIKNKIENSWNKIFDMDFESSDISVSFEEKKIQATFWELRLTDIKNVDKFKAK
ncbi:DUF3841 domain-containing protein [Aquimarina litoralis]|uniref:DUF3841 domain-containing protein n=1 Tax=Aquimarina litoralis TaxID=584605 RepID=UPI001C56C60D|nr:DUF3841 domain-containing protein [Aquimarina litoralis]MBW1296345.1 DUF3841 domain-containing protein [Aquimarina litoralis]